MKKLRLIGSFILLVVSLEILGAECENYQIKIIFEGKDVFTKEVMCAIKDEENMRYYVSQSCKNEDCEIFKKNIKPLKIKNYFSRVGSPGFKLCDHLGGVPQIFSFKKNSEKNWQTSERCLMNLSDFIEISLLTDKWKKHIISN